jgi:hypothetical protein
MFLTITTGSTRPGSTPGCGAPSCGVRSGGVLVTSVVALALLGLGNGLEAQSVGGSQASPRVFAQPQDVSFAHIQAAMEGKFGAYYVEQTRRAITSKPGQPVKFEGVLEQLTFRPADPVAKAAARFKLSFYGIEGRTLKGNDFARRAALFGNQAGFTFQHRGFHVVDAALAAKQYDLMFLARETRSTRQGVRDVYRMAVIPKRWDRTGWILLLDTATGYPVYMGEYALGSNAIDLRSELFATYFLSGVRVPDAKDKSWWAPIKGIEAMASAGAAVKKALTKSTKYVLPMLSELPGGFRLETSEVHTDPYSGDRSALLGFTDGVDRIFVTERNVPLKKRGREDTIWYRDEKGLTQCGFSHHGVAFRVVGRSVRDTVRKLSLGVFRRAVAVLK